jgi:hypothetical protein
MLNQYYIPEGNIQSAELRQYCKMENVLPGDLKCATLPRKTIRIRLEKMAIHMLRPLNNGLNSVVARLLADLEHKGFAQRYSS